MLGASASERCKDSQCLCNFKATRAAFRDYVVSKQLEVHSEKFLQFHSKSKDAFRSLVADVKP